MRSTTGAANIVTLAGRRAQPNQACARTLAQSLAQSAIPHTRSLQVCRSTITKFGCATGSEPVFDSPALPPLSTEQPIELPQKIDQGSGVRLSCAAPGPESLAKRQPGPAAGCGPARLHHGRNRPMPRGGGGRTRRERGTAPLCGRSRADAPTCVINFGGAIRGPALDLTRPALHSRAHAANPVKPAHLRSTGYCCP